MKAMVWTKYGPPDVLQLKEVEKPTPRDDEVLIRIFATTVTAGDSEARALQLPFWLSLLIRAYVGLLKPTRITILGQELAGEVEAVGKDVSLFKTGDRVFAATGFGFGSYAEYKCLPENGVMALKPVNLTNEQAAAVPVGALEALHFIRIGNLKPGEQVLIVGAGGSIGTYAVQLARYFGADVAGMDKTGKLAMLRALGADQVIDYTKEDFSLSGGSYDVIIDVIGKSSYSRCVRALKPFGRYLMANQGLFQSIRGMWTGLTSNKKVIFGAAIQKKEDLVYLKELIEAGKIKPVIDRTYPLEQTAEAHRYVETGQKKGNVVISVGIGNTR
jgi:2-desacetyl-2-hydroxyethyl bacteriochlorophyllide A dehydrogenase